MPTIIIIIVLVLLMFTCLGCSWGDYFPARPYGYSGAGLFGIIVLVLIVHLLF
jgi:hypothetical protein